MPTSLRTFVRVRTDFLSDLSDFRLFDFFQDERYACPRRKTYRATTPGNGIVSALKGGLPKADLESHQDCYHFTTNITGYEQKWYHITTIFILYII